MALPKKSNFAREPQSGRGSMIVGTHRTRPARRAPYIVLDTVEALTRRATMEVQQW